MRNYAEIVGWLLMLLSLFPPDAIRSAGLVVAGALLVAASLIQEGLLGAKP